MAKIERHRDIKTKKEHDIDTDTGDVKEVTPETPEAWSPKKRMDLERCKILVGQITNQAINIVDEKNIQTIAHALAVFGDPAGRELFASTCLYQTIYNTDAVKEYFTRALNTSKYKTPQKFLNICQQYGLQMLIGEDDYDYLLMEGTKPAWYTEKIDDDQVRDIQVHGFMELRNQYYFAEINNAEKRITLSPKSNFTIKVLYHIHRGKNNKRVIAIKNNRNEQSIMEIETKEINSLQAFKSLTEGCGYYVVYHSFREIELAKIKNKIFSEEKPSKQLEILGWENKKSFFAFSNGIYQVGENKFHAVDEFGIVSIADTHYHIPYHPGTEEHSFMNEKKIFYTEGKTEFKGWAKLYMQAFGMVGATVLSFTVATIFSDFIFSVKNNFPMLFLYGEGGSGKGTVCEFAQQLFGHPQPPLKLTEKANTDKARVRKFATYANVPVRLEEFSNSLEMAAIKTLTNFHDRFGYERASMETKFGTETVPIRSTVMITGNEYPADDPLMQRLILQDSDKNTYTDEEIAAFRELQKINAGGITSVLVELLQYRAGVVEKWREVYESEYDLFRQACQEMDVPSRMMENYSVLLATHRCLADLGLKWPVTYDRLRTYFLASLQNQSEKRATGAVTQRFWDIVLSLVNKNQIHEAREFLLDGPGLYIRFKEIHTMYMEEHLRIYRQPGLLANTLLQKLKISPAFIEYVSSKRFGKVNTSCFKFDYLKLNVDLLYVVNQKRSHADTALLQTDDELKSDAAAAEAARIELEQQKARDMANPGADPDGGAPPEFLTKDYDV